MRVGLILEFGIGFQRVFAVDAISDRVDVYNCSALAQWKTLLVKVRSRDQERLRIARYRPQRLRIDVLQP
jgi:hypothetical protein